MVKNHPRAGKSHDFFYAFSHFGLVTMYPAIGAEGLDLGIVPVEKLLDEAKLSCDKVLEKF